MKGVLSVLVYKPHSKSLLIELSADSVVKTYSVYKLGTHTGF